MEKRCEVPYCFEVVADLDWDFHQDQHLAERLAAEEFEGRDKQYDDDKALACALAEECDKSFYTQQSIDDDFQLALALRDEFLAEEEEQSFRDAQRWEIGVENAEEEEYRNKTAKIDDPLFISSSQITHDSCSVASHHRFLSNQSPGLIYGLQRALESSHLSAYSVLCHPATSHFGAELKTFGWGCGYNNAQMLLSCLREISPDEYRKVFGGDIPTIRTLQTLIEAGWSKGIDNVGASQLHRTVLGTRKWIGTTEIYTLLTSAGFRCLVHDFEFQKPPYAASLTKYVEDYFKCSNTGESRAGRPSCRLSDRPPLYFQHHGHSRTIVGIEYLKSGKINFLIFDPARKPSSIIKDFANGNMKDSCENALRPFRVSLEGIAKRKNYQILRLQDGMMDPVEYETRKEVHFLKMN